jgi:GTP-binding protein Era
MNEKKAAFVALAGRPSAGKSTLLNRICGEKVSIVSAVPQTTRNAIRGIINRAQGQIVFVDTPGRHASEKKINKKLMEVSDRSIHESDLVLYVLDASRKPGPEEEAVALTLAPMADKTAVAVNKIDISGTDIEKAGAFVREKLPGLKPERVFPVSALSGAGIAPLLSCLYEMAPAGGAFYPEEYYTDQDVQFRIAEIIREKAINRLRQELPHSLYVDVADMEFKDSSNNDSPNQDSGNQISRKRRLWVRAFILVERESQKGMVVGKGGAMIKAIRQDAQKDLNRVFDWKTELDLRVKTARDWRHNDGLLKKLIGG